jgi:hypothetical protein
MPRSVTFSWQIKVLGMAVGIRLIVSQKQSDGVGCAFWYCRMPRSISIVIRPPLPMPTLLWWLHGATIQTSTDPAARAARNAGCEAAG